MPREAMEGRGRQQKPTGCNGKRREATGGHLNAFTPRHLDTTALRHFDTSTLRHFGTSRMAMGGHGKPGMATGGHARPREVTGGHGKGGHGRAPRHLDTLTPRHLGTSAPRHFGTSTSAPRHLTNGDGKPWAAEATGGHGRASRTWLFGKA